MRKSTIFILIIVLASLLMACNKNKDDTTGIIVNDSIEEVTEDILVKYGDGSQIIMDDGKSISHVIRSLKSMNYKEVERPDTVGQSFILQLSKEKELEYASTGYIRIDETLYKASNADIVAELNEFVIQYGLEEFPELLGSD
ncbi:hypothetical protein [Cohnella luojiensis]|uniref:Uncharacterized protein n=1 Tax=Cohnella luojiensis TaxID=652876 RepID=A0A4Y8LYN6_9BACL|nr:hypothetical protein [Cohnella luojiensis]TFE25950.1 hypothetical protein E2980_12330 [Cohnella luojiensis]